MNSGDLTMFEGGHINLGWLDYWDNHLTTELKYFLEFQYYYEDIKKQDVGDIAYATLKYNFAIKMKKREVSGKV